MKGIRKVEGELDQLASCEEVGDGFWKNNAAII